MQKQLQQQREVLQKRLKKIQNNFRFTPKITGITSTQEDKLRAIIALSHAEIEDYFETIASKLLEESEKIWHNNKIANYNLAALFMRSEQMKKKLDLNNTFFQIIKEYNEQIKKSHGIKQENIHKLFYPLGYEDTDFDSLFLSQLDSFGSKRGQIVHTSAKKTTQALNQGDVINMIDNISNALEDFENVILSKL